MLAGSVDLYSITPDINIHINIYIHTYTYVNTYN